jgi:hypothetical protein
VSASGAAAIIILALVCCGASDTVNASGDDAQYPQPSNGGDYPHLPAGMTVIGEFDGTIREADGHAFGLDFFSEWSSSARNQTHVQDPSNPTGSGLALRFTYPASDPTSGVATAMHFPGGPYRELYVMARVYFETGGWNFGNKLFYIGAPSGQRNNVGSPTQFYTDRFADGRIRVINQNGTNDKILDSSDGPPSGTNARPIRNGEWLSIEYHFVGSSSERAGDGRMYVWVNGTLVGRNDAVRWLATGFDGLEWYAKTDTNVSITSSYRLGELFVAGKE